MIPAVFLHGTTKLKDNEVLPAHLYEDLRNPDNKTVTCKVGNIDFSGNTLKDDPVQYVLVGRCKGSKKLYFGQDKLVLLKPQFKDDEDVHLDKTKVDAKYNHDSLTKKFGHVHRKRALKDKEQAKFNASAVVDAARVHAAVSKIPKLDNLGDPDRARMLPPWNVQAEYPRDVYDMNVVAPTSVLDALKEEAEQLIEADAGKLEEWKTSTLYLRTVINRLANRPSGGERLQRFAEKLCLLNWMGSLHKLSYKQIQRKELLPQAPQTVAKHLLNNFTTTMTTAHKNNQRCMPSTMKDKLMYHMLALLLNLEEYSFAMDDLLVDFKMSSDRMTKFCRYMGCKVTSKTTTGPLGDKHKEVNVELTVPLTFPDSTSEGSRKRKSMPF